MSQFADVGEFVLLLLEMLFHFIVSIPSILTSGIEFITFILIRLPSIITNNMFSELPFVFRYGLSGAFGVVILISFLKIYSLVKP